MKKAEKNIEEIAEKNKPKNTKSASKEKAKDIWCLCLRGGIL